MIKPQTLKGFRDFLPEDAIKRQFIIDKIKKVFDLYGFDPLETPALEYAETLLGKYGDEADKLLYLFKDRGGRNVGMRYDQTVPLARVIARYKNEIPLPFKRYQIQPVWRAENTQKGRYREFLQCDIDTIGVSDLSADAEIIATSLETMKALGFKGYSMRINDRQIFEKFNLSRKAIIELDKVDKEGPVVFIKQLIKEGLSTNQADNIFNSLNKDNRSEILAHLFTLLKEMGFNEGRNNDFWYDPTLARGLEYYTSTIFELRIEDYGSLSVAGGGRYDKLIGQFTGKNIPAVGIAYGFDRIVDAMEQLNLLPTKATATQVLITVFSKEFINDSLRVTSKLRELGINAEIALSIDKLDKQLKYADKKGIPYVVIIGPDEAKDKTVTLKNLRTKEQKTISVEKLPDVFKHS